MSEARLEVSRLRTSTQRVQASTHQIPVFQNTHSENASRPKYVIHDTGTLRVGRGARAFRRSLWLVNV